MAEPITWRGIDELARAVGWYAWTEHRVFEVTGGWAAQPEADGGADGPAADARVWFAAASRRHAALARCWAARLPVRAGVDAAALVTAPPGPLAAAFEALGALSDFGGGVRVLVEAVLPGLDRLYARHLGTASPVSEAPVMEALAHARCALAGERVSGGELLQGMQQASPGDRALHDAFEQAFDEISVFPAVRPS